MTSKNIIEKIQNNFSRHIAKALSSLDIGKVDNEIKIAVKSEFWNACDDVLLILESSEVSKEERANEIKQKN